MADYSNTGFDPSSFNYGTAADQVAQQRALAQKLMDTKQLQGQMVPGGPNGFYVKPSPWAQLATALQQGIGAYGQRKANEASAQNDKNSQAALEYQLQHMNDSTMNGVSKIGGQPDSVTPGITPDAPPAPSAAMPPQAPPSATPSVSQGPSAPSPMPPPQASPDISPVNVTAQKMPMPQVSPEEANRASAISQLSRSGKGHAAAPVSEPTNVTSILKITDEKGTFTVPDTLGNRWEYRNKYQVVPLIQDDKAATPPTPQVPPQALAAQLQKAPQAPQVNPQQAALAAQLQKPPQAPPQPPMAAPPMQGPPAPSAPPMAPQGQPGPMPPMPPQAPPAPPQSAAMPPQANDGLNPISTTNVKYQPNMVAPDQGTQIARLAALGNTGKMGQAIAASQINAMGLHDGRYKDIHNSDGEVTGVLDTATGRLVSGGGENGPSNKTQEMELKLRQQVDPNNAAAVQAHQQWQANHGMNPMTADQIRGSNMSAQDRATQNRQDQTQQKDLAKEHENYQSSISGIQGLISQLDRMDHLYDTTSTGPMAGNLPAWTDNRQELKNLTGSNVFAGVREAVDGAGGGSQRFTQGELQHFANGNGGLSLSTSPTVAHNIIAQQRSVLEAKLKAIQAADKATPANSNTGVQVPARGQTFNGPNAAAASALGIQ